MTPLPIDAHLPAIVDALRTERSAVVVAEPGAGKTTRVPPAILAAQLLSREHPQIVMLQPRRVAARASATRIADEQSWRLGGEVGYQVRFERVVSRDTRLRVVTEGILTRELLANPELPGIGCVILDEFHERSIHVDLVLAMLRDVRASVREDLLVIVMSATLDAEPVARFLGGASRPAPIVRVPGRTFPIETSYRPLNGRPIEAGIADALNALFDSPDDDGGDVLAFLPGAAEIDWALEAISPIARSRNLAAYPLHGSLPADRQQLALAPSPKRKVICATNIAETSLTIEGVSAVIDGGLARVAGYDAARGLDSLRLERISKASATQRAGRAGRTKPGRCVRLWSTKEQNELDAFELPELMRVDLAGTTLDLHAWGERDVRAFGWYEPPPERSIAAAERLLRQLGALDDAGAITLLGKRMAALPTHPRLGRLLIRAADEGLAEDGALLAAMLSERDVFASHRVAAPNTRGKSDVLTRLEAMRAVGRAFRPAVSATHGRSEGPPYAVVQAISRLREQFFRTIERTAARRKPANDEDILKLILAAYPDRVARRRERDPAAAIMVGGTGLRIARESIVWDAELFVAVDVRVDERIARGESLVRIASAIEPAWLDELFPGRVIERRECCFDESRGRAIATVTRVYDDLALEVPRETTPTASESVAALAAAVRERAAAWIRADESAANWLARVELLRRSMPEQAWPKTSDDALAELAAAASTGKRSIEDVRRGSWVELLQSSLHYPLDRLLAEHAPESIEVPSGSMIRLDYTAAGPVLAVRLQELFGLPATPRIAGGRVPVVLHLLGPNYRPVQITEDLASFWINTYPQVRKDLRARYPKHSWPEDPMTARPEARGRRRS